MTRFRDFDLELTDWARDDAGRETLRVRVAASPAGEQRRAEAAAVAFDAALRAECAAFDRRELGAAGLAALGRALGDLLLPEPARALYERSRAALAEGEGLRLRLKIDGVGLADLPWELVWLAPAGGEAPPEAANDATGFLALDPALSLVRYELLEEPLGVLSPVSGRILRLAALFAPVVDPQWPPLDLAHEAAAPRHALAGRDELAVDVRERGTVAELESALARGAHLFHFAGHGRFAATLGERVGTIEGQGFLELCGEDGGAVEVSADALAVNLRGRGVRLAVLGACEGARRDGVNPWTGIAPALVRGGLPAVVAMQATLRDASAVAFSGRFYEALAAGETIDDAVTAGRLAIFNRSGAGERDWAVPALYLRAEAGVLFPVETDEESLRRPLGIAGWVNVGLSTVAAALLAAAFYLFARPRIPDAWLLGGGLSLATVAGAALAWMLWLAGDDVRAWVRRLLRRRWTLPVLGAGVAAAGALFALLWVGRPVVLRVVPGTRLMPHLPKLGAPSPEGVYTLRVWQAASAAMPTHATPTAARSDGAAPPAQWSVAVLHQPGVALGAPPATAEAMLERAEGDLRARLEAYLAERVPAGVRSLWLARWALPDAAADVAGDARLRPRGELRFELLRDGVPVPLAPPVVERLGNALEETVEIVFLEPADGH